MSISTTLPQQACCVKREFHWVVTRDGSSDELAAALNHYDANGLELVTILADGRAVARLPFDEYERRESERKKAVGK